MTLVVPGYGEYVGTFGFHARPAHRTSRGVRRRIVDLSYVTIRNKDGRDQFVRFPGRMPDGITETCKGHQVQVSCFVYRVFANGLGGDANKETVICLEEEEHVLLALLGGVKK